MRRLAVLLLVLGLLAPAPAALAQSSPFGPLPQAPPAETPAPTAVENSAAQDDVGRSTLLLIAAGVMVVFVGLGIAITRDARRNLTEDDRLALERGPATTGRQRNVQKAKARQKGKAQRDARRRARR
jgi:hypothetical protein